MPSSPHAVAPVEVAQLFLGRSYSGSPERGSKSLRTTQRGRGATGPSPRLWAPSPSLSAVSFLTPPRARAFLSRRLPAPSLCSGPPRGGKAICGSPRHPRLPCRDWTRNSPVHPRLGSHLARSPCSPVRVLPPRTCQGEDRNHLPRPLPVSNPSRHAPLLRLRWQHPRFRLSRG